MEFAAKDKIFISDKKERAIKVLRKKKEKGCLNSLTKRDIEKTQLNQIKKIITIQKFHFLLLYYTCEKNNFKSYYYLLYYFTTKWLTFFVVLDSAGILLFI